MFQSVLGVLKHVNTEHHIPLFTMLKYFLPLWVTNPTVKAATLDKRPGAADPDGVTNPAA